MTGMGLCACVGACARVFVCMCCSACKGTAEPAAGARGMQYPVESNGTFKETADQHATNNQKPVGLV